MSPFEGAEGERTRTGSLRRRERLSRLALLVALAALGVGLRAYHLGWPPLWADEAESAINALTIVAGGLPVDHYLGLPIYENVLVEPWPESREYAFRDISYSRRGLAVYHGWLPLYATAAAFRLAGVTPAAATRGALAADTSTDQLVRWTVVPRLPALVFSGLLVLVGFELGRRTGGPDAGWAMALGSAASGLFVWLGRQARYYSPTLALGALCGLAVWNAQRRGRVRDHVLAGVALALLFHTQALAAVAAAALYVVSLPLASRPLRAIPLVTLGGATAAALTLPWAWWSGFLGMEQRIPAAHRLLDPAALLDSLPSSRAPVLLTAAAGLLGALAVFSMRHRLGSRWTQPLARFGPGLAFAAAWLVLAWATFVLLVPAASYFPLRLKLMVAVPGLLLIVLVAAAAVRVVLPAAGAAWTSAAVLALLALAGQVPPPLPPAAAPGGEYDLVRLVRGWRLAPGGRIYAMPANQLVLTYYTGLPVQSVSAVRKSWLDAFAGDLVVIDNRWYEPLAPREVAAIAGRYGTRPTRVEAEALSRAAARLATVEDLAARGYDVRPSVAPKGAAQRTLVAETRRATERFLKGVVRGTPLAREAVFSNWSEFWQFYFFWFADPRKHVGPALNFRDRALASPTYVLPSGWIVHDCRPRRDPPLVAADP